MRYAAHATSTGNTKYSISTSGELMNQKRKSAKPEERHQRKQHISVKIINHVKHLFIGTIQMLCRLPEVQPRCDEPQVACDKTNRVPNGESGDLGRE
jgi:hypothetical protein